MGEKTIYFLFTDTGTYLAKAINYCTKKSLNHVSIGFDNELRKVYSFGRKRSRNPFIGGFVEEDVNSDFLKSAKCAIYSYSTSEAEYESIVRNIKTIEAQKSNYKYNFIGLFGVLLGVEIKRKDAMFCSQFVATVLKDAETIRLTKKACFITPSDIRSHEGMNLLFEGKLEDYCLHIVNSGRKLVKGEQILPKQSFIILLSSKVKRFVIR
ncbi:hypothetical protein QGM71_12850 [Virgibacillus sp. C22-A2]|uniref:Uncharacterized protein n=1 Tax=Virgibacillus tibetensis TaxID=3042313 RepID=A0ABU6KGY9_9BACI|nr:hypothetical protein [Virgibacillus sp. C22-A2]